MVGDCGHVNLLRNGRGAHEGLSLGRAALPQPFRLRRGLDTPDASRLPDWDESIVEAQFVVQVVLHFVVSKLSNNLLGISCTFLKVA